MAVVVASCGSDDDNFVVVEDGVDNEVEEEKDGTLAVDDGTSCRGLRVVVVVAAVKPEEGVLTVLVLLLPVLLLLLVVAFALLTALATGETSFTPSFAPDLRAFDDNDVAVVAAAEGFDALESVFDEEGAIIAVLKGS